MAMAVYDRRRLHDSRSTYRIHHLPWDPRLTQTVLSDGKWHCIGQGQREESQHPTTRKAGTGCLQEVVETVAYLGLHSLLCVSYSVFVMYGDATEMLTELAAWSSPLIQLPIWVSGSRQRATRSPKSIISQLSSMLSKSLLHGWDRPLLPYIPRGLFILLSLSAACFQHYAW